MSKEQTSQDNDPKGKSRNENFIRSRKRFKAYTWKYSRTISPFGSFILLVSQIFGFGMNGIPSVMREGGWLPALLANLGICITAALCSLMLLRAMTWIPHNDNFDQRIEYNTLVKYYLSDFTFKVVSCLHHIGDLCSVICGILTFSKLLDMLLVRTVGCTFALQLYPRVGFYKVDLHLVGQIYEMETFESAVFAITLGYIICALVCLRLSACALEETMGFHRITFAVMIGCILQLCVSSFRRIRGDETVFVPPPRIGRYSFYNTLLTFVENYSVASTTPAWANEMTAQVRVVPTMWLSSLFACGIYHALGYLLCVAFPANSGSVVRDVLMASSGVLTNSCICLFVAVTVLPDVVFGCISTRYNLLNLGYCRETVAYLWGCVFPFIFTWTMSNENLFMDVINHMALISALVCDFVIPTILYVVASQLNDSCSTTFDSSSMASPFRHAGTIFFSKFDTFKRKITGEVSAPTSVEMACTVTFHKQPTGAVESQVDYGSFKIIRPPKQPRSDDHLYNVLEPRKKSRQKYDAEYYLDVAENEPGSCPPSNRNKSTPRLRVFPLESFAQQECGDASPLYESNIDSPTVVNSSCLNYDDVDANFNECFTWERRLKVLRETRHNLCDLGHLQHYDALSSVIDLVESLCLNNGQTSPCETTTSRSNISSITNDDAFSIEPGTPITSLVCSKSWQHRIYAMDELKHQMSLDKCDGARVATTISNALVILLKDNALKVFIKGIELLTMLLKWEFCPQWPSDAWGKAKGPHFEIIKCLVGRLSDPRAPVVTSSIVGLLQCSESVLLVPVLRVLARSLDRQVQCKGTPKAILTQLRLLATLKRRGIDLHSLYQSKRPLKAVLEALKLHGNAQVSRGACTVLGQGEYGNNDSKAMKNTRLKSKCTNLSDKNLEPYGKEIYEAFQRLSNAVRMGLNPTFGSVSLDIHALKDC